MTFVPRQKSETFNKLYLCLKMYWCFNTIRSDLTHRGGGWLCYLFIAQRCTVHAEIGAII